MFVEIEHSLTRERNEEMRRTIHAGQLERRLKERRRGGLGVRDGFVCLRAWLRIGGKHAQAENA